MASRLAVGLSPVKRLPEFNAPMAQTVAMKATPSRTARATVENKTFFSCMDFINTFSRSGSSGNLKTDKNGALERIRTSDHLIRSQVLYPAELRVHKPTSHG